MDLFFTAKEIVKKHHGKVSFSDFHVLLKNQYSKEALIDFLKKQDTFQFDGNYITSYPIKIDLFLEQLKSIISNFKPNPNIIKYVIISKLLQYLKLNQSINNQYTLEYDLLEENDIPFDKNLNTDLTWDDEFKSTPEKLYQFNYRLFEFLIVQEQMNYGIFSTPQTIIELFCKLMPDKQELKIYNPTAGFLNLATALKVFSNSKLKIIASEINPGNHYLGQVFSFIHGLNVNFSCTDSGEEILQLPDSDFDLVISNLPFAVKDRNNIFKNRKYKELSMHLISESLHKLKNPGRAIFLVNEGILYSGQKEAIAFRKEIITSGSLTCVISLPSGIMSQTNVKASLLVFDKGYHKDSVQLIDASEMGFYTLNPDKSILLDVDKIISLVSWEKSSSSLVEVYEPKVRYGNWKGKINVSVNELQDNVFELSAGKYIAKNKPFQGDDYKTLNEVCHPLKTKKTEKTSFYPFIRITELNGEILSINENSMVNSQNQSGRTVNESAILIGTIKGSYKPTWFTGENTIVVSNNIAVLGFDNKKVFPPYLIQELNAEYVTSQFNLLAKGSVINSITRDDLLSVKVKLPSIERQKRIYSERTTFGREHKLTPNYKMNAVSDVNLISVARHEIGNILGGLSGFMDLLPNFLAKNNIDPNTPFVVNQPETIQEMLQSSASQINQINWLMDNLKGIILSDYKSFNPVKTELRTFIEKSLKNEILKNEMNWFVTTERTYNNNKKIYAEIDNGQFKLILQNMALNALNHGKADRPLNFVVNIKSLDDLSPADKFVSIEFINDGNPLPVEFKMEDYTSFGVKTGNSRGQGLGGFIINRVVENHSGTLKLITPGLNIEVEPGKIVQSNVNFSITIPINQ
jgi:type I restriction enzyme M protein